MRLTEETYETTKDIGLCYVIYQRVAGALSLGALVLAGCFAACSPSISSPFVVKLTLSPLAQEKLRETGERVSVWAQYYWRPNSGGPSHDDDELGYVLGGYPVGEESHEGEADTSRLIFRGHTRANPHIQEGRGEAWVLINVFSARRASSNNILHCSVFEDALALASSKGVNVNCSLIEEHR